MYKNRAAIVLAVFFTIFFALLARLYYFQIYQGEKLSKAASVQRMAESPIEKPRGNILDRNGISFTNRSKKIIAVLRPLDFSKEQDAFKRVCEILGMDFLKTKKEFEIAREPVLVEVDQEKKQEIMDADREGVSFIESLKRYDEMSIAKHVLGYLNRIDQVGEAGIEKFYEDVLKSDDENAVGVVTDGQKNPLKGLGYRMLKTKSDKKMLNVKLTLDYHIQKIAEDAMGRNNISGAAVVEDVCTGDIVAMVSKPDFDPNDVGKYLASPGNELFNRAVGSYNLGSIFKIIDVARGCEAQVTFDDKFFCPGFVKVGDKVFKCSSFDKGGHGVVDLTKAFATSCNSYFIDLGIKLGYKNIISMAQRFQLGSCTGIREQGVDESAGNLPDINKPVTDGDVANISIGQGDILATPLQIADLVATVANGGIKNSVNIVDSIVDDDGNTVKDLRRRGGTRIISKEIADKIKYLMEEVISEGTGTKANLDQYGGAGGKTGSAETGQYINGNKVVHAWFAGYFPKSDPKYSIAVLVEDGKMGGKAAAPIFTEIAEEIMKKKY